MAITASVQPEPARIVYVRSDFPRPFLFQIFSKEGMGRTVQNRPGWPGQGLAKHIWFVSKPVCRNHLARFWQDSTGPLPVSHFETRFGSSTDVPDNIVQNQPGSDLVLADCVRFWPNGSGPEASQCARIIRPASGQCFPADPDRIRHVYWGGDCLTVFVTTIDMGPRPFSIYHSDSESDSLCLFCCLYTHNV